MLTCDFQIRFNNSPRKLSQCLNIIIATERRRHATVILWKKELVSLTLIGVHRGQASVMKNTTQISPIKWLFNVFKLRSKQQQWWWVLHSYKDFWPRFHTTDVNTKMNWQNWNELAKYANQLNHARSLQL